MKTPALVGATVLLAPRLLLASPPPYFDPTGISLAPLFVVMGLLGLLGVAVGLLRSRQRPGPVFLVSALAGSALLATWAIVHEPPFQMRYWGAGLEVEAALLATVSLAAWVWGKGPARRSRRRLGGLVLAAALLVSAGLWGAAFARAAASPFHVSKEVPRECGEAFSWSPPEEIARNRWFDYRAVQRSAGGVDEIVTAAPLGDEHAVDLVVFRQGSRGAAIVSERRVVADGVWGGLASDRSGRIYASWTSFDRRHVTIARLAPDLAVAETRRYATGQRQEPPQILAGTFACLAYSVWDDGDGRYGVLEVDGALRPIEPLAAAASQLGEGRALSGWIALLASALVVTLVLARRLAMRRLARRERWEGRVLPDGATLETADGTLVRVDPPPGVAPGESCCVLGRRDRKCPGGPYRDAAVIVTAERVLPGTWGATIGQMRDHQGRIELMAAAAIALLATSAVDLMVLGSTGAGW